MNSLKKVFGPATKIGLVKSYHGHLQYGVDHGWGMSLPGFAKDMIVTVWNKYVCTFKGHDTIGPFEAQVKVPGYRPGIYPKTCSACNKRWKEDE